MPRALWRGSLSFGLVNIPVELHTAVRQSRPKFRMLHAKDKSPVKFERVCLKDGRPVAWEDLVKGFEYEKGRFVVLTKEDFKANLMRIIDAKLKGKSVELESSGEPRQAEVVDLMERLRRSLEQTGKRAKPRKAAARKRARRAA